MRFLLILVVSIAFCVPCARAQAPLTNTPNASATPPSTNRFEEDGWLDVSDFLDKKYGFLPIVIPITEPAVGYGAAGGLTFISKPLGESQAGFGRPDITIVGGMGTENGSWGAFAGDIRHWLDDRLQTVVAGVYASANLKFYGIGDNPRLENDPLEYNLEPKGALVQASTESVIRDYGPVRVTPSNTKVSFDVPASTSRSPKLPSRGERSRAHPVHYLGIRVITSLHRCAGPMPN